MANQTEILKAQADFKVKPSEVANELYVPVKIGEVWKDQATVESVRKQLDKWLKLISETRREFDEGLKAQQAIGNYSQVKPFRKFREDAVKAPEDIDTAALFD